MRLPPELPGRRGRRRPRAPAGGRGRDARRLGGRPDVPLPRPPRLPLLAALGPGGDRRDVPVHDRACAVAAARCRAAAPNPDGQILADVEGATAYAAGRAPHISGITAARDTLTIRLTRPAGDLARAAQHVVLLPGPGRHADVAGGGTATPIAMAGPYYVASANGGQVVVEKNPNYTGGRPRRIERIVYTDGVTPVDAVARVQRGRADYVNGDMVGYDPPGRSRPAARSTAPTAWRAGPAERADRATSPARRPGSTRSPSTRAGRSSATRGCVAPSRTHSIGRRSPPCTASSRPTTSSPRRQRGGGKVAYPNEPDLATARRLAGRGRRTARLYACGDPTNGVRIAGIVRANLARIGIDVRIDQSLGCLNGPETRAARRGRHAARIARRPVATRRRSSSSRSATGTRRPATGAPAEPASGRSRAPGGRAGPRGPPPTSGWRRPSCATPHPSRSTRAVVDPEFVSERVGCRISQGALSTSSTSARSAWAEGQPRARERPREPGQLLARREAAGTRAAVHDQRRHTGGDERSPRRSEPLAPPAGRQPHDDDAGRPAAATTPLGPGIGEGGLDVDADEPLDGDRRRREEPAGITSGPAVP